MKKAILILVLLLAFSALAPVANFLASAVYAQESPEPKPEPEPERKPQPEPS